MLVSMKINNTNEHFKIFSPLLLGEKECDPECENFGKRRCWGESRFMCQMGNTYDWSCFEIKTYNKYAGNTSG